MSEKTKINDKEAWVGPFFKKNNKSSWYSLLNRQKCWNHSALNNNNSEIFAGDGSDRGSEGQRRGLHETLRASRQRRVGAGRHRVPQANVVSHSPPFTGLEWGSFDNVCTNNNCFHMMLYKILEGQNCIKPKCYFSTEQVRPRPDYRNMWAIFLKKNISIWRY